MSVPDRHRLRERLDAALDAAPPRPPPLPEPDAALDAAARERLVAFVELLAKWNRVWNLTAVRDPLDMLGRHVLDALTLVPFVDAETGGDPATDRVRDPVADPDGDGATPRFDLIDVGSGAGLPVLVLAIARPALACLSIERTSKKARFQRQAALELGLDRVTVADERVEAVRARARIVTSRAFAAPADFLTIAAPLTAPGGAALVMLGRADRLPATLPGGWSAERTVDTSAASAPGRAGTGGAATLPERHVAVCRRAVIPYDPPP